MTPDGPPLGSTYRMQLSGIGFAGARDQVGYLAALGIETLYVSPILAATPGSTHGYDVIDHSRLDPALGTPETFEALLAELEVHGMRMLIDIVPNHMATGPANLWWWDLLRRGRDSEYAPVFDVDWSKHDDRILVPTLSRPLAELLGTAKPVIYEGNRALALDGQNFPLRSGTRSHLSPTSMLALQHYRPAYWRLSNQEGNYRRFFDIDGLIGVRVEDSAVFRRTHALLIAIGGDERIAGWRVDHIDGLTDPNSYSQHLAKSMEGRRRTRAVILVEKILAHDEEVPTNWVVDGTTGYEFADRAGGLFVDPNGARALLEVGQVTTGDTSTFADLALQGKRSVLTHLFGSPMARLSELVGEALNASHPGHDLSKSDVRKALVELTVHLNVYRTYLDGGPVDRADRRRVAAAAAAAAAHVTSTECQRALKLITEGLTSTATPWLEPAWRWQQLTGAVMAKGVEDTATYRYSGLLGHAEVGCDPDHAGAQPEDFHRLARTHRRYPSSLNATATHDSKRSEDVRARLFAVSEVHDDWAALVARWRRRFRTTGTNEKGPDPHDEWVIYQALLGVWPFGTGGPDQEVRCRVQDYAVKSAREAKRRTAWVDPDTSYERSLVTFIDHVTQEQRFVREMSGFVARIGPAAATNSLATVVLKAITPGVPDFYQGTELWDFSLTDPDNRRPVNFELRRELLDSLPRHNGSTPELAGAAKSLLADWQDGKVKLHLTRVLLHFRRLHPKLFARGSYHVLESKGTKRDHVVAIARHYRREWVVAVVPRQMIDVVGPARFPIGERAWGHTAIRLPRFARGEIVDVVTGCPITAQGGRIRLDACLSLLPVSVLTNLRSGTGSYSGTTETGGSPLAIRGTQEI